MFQPLYKPAMIFASIPELLNTVSFRLIAHPLPFVLHQIPRNGQLPFAIRLWLEYFSSVAGAIGIYIEPVLTARMPIDKLPFEIAPIVVDELAVAMRHAIQPLAQVVGFSIEQVVWL